MRETLIGCLPNRAPGPQPRPVPWLGHLTGDLSVRRTMPSLQSYTSQGLTTFFKIQINQICLIFMNLLCLMFTFEFSCYLLCLWHKFSWGYINKILVNMMQNLVSFKLVFSCSSQNKERLFSNGMACPKSASTSLSVLRLSSIEGVYKN